MIQHPFTFKKKKQAVLVPFLLFTLGFQVIVLTYFQINNEIVLNCNAALVCLNSEAALLIMM